MVSSWYLAVGGCGEIGWWGVVRGLRVETGLRGVEKGLRGVEGVERGRIEGGGGE